MVWTSTTSIASNSESNSLLSQDHNSIQGWTFSYEEEENFSEVVEETPFPTEAVVEFDLFKHGMSYWSVEITSAKSHRKQIIKTFSTNTGL